MTKRDRKIGAALCAAQLIAGTSAIANNIQVSSVTLQNIDTTADTAMVQFNLSWENSWRVATGPANHDAAWVFVKFHTGDRIWRTATLDVSDAAHAVPAAATLDVGVNGTKGVGAFVYRAGTGTGNNTFNAIKLKWNYGVDGVSDAALVTLDVHSIEMVYIPEGAFQVGDGVARAGTGDTASFNAGGGTTPFLITNNGPIAVGPVAGSLAHASLAAGTYKPIPTTFPNGFDPYYIMKYEVSQGQWAAFINATEKLPSALSYNYFDTLVVPNAGTGLPPEAINARQVFTSPNFPYTSVPVPLPAATVPPTPLTLALTPPIPTRPIVVASTPDRAFNAAKTPPVATINVTTTANSLNATTAATTNLAVGMPLSGNVNIPRGAVVASITNATTFVLGNVAANTVTAGAAVVTTLASGQEEVPLAYLDWAGLRPLTEFEYEKAARGPVDPIAGEFAWGTADVALLTYGPDAPTATPYLNNDGMPNEFPADNYNESGGNAWTRATILRLDPATLAPVLGTCRVGMFAKPAYNGATPPRIQSGAGYYGVMDLTGNVSEMVVKWPFALNTSTVAIFNGEHGDGNLGANGIHNVTGWFTTVAPVATFFGLRGGSFNEQATPVSQRSTLAGGTMSNPGIRGVRSAPVAAP